MNSDLNVNTVNLEDHPEGHPLGIILAPLIARRTSVSPLESHYTILIGYTRPYNKLGIIQKSGQIRIGDRLVTINNISVRDWTFEKIIRVIRCFGGNTGVELKSLGFEVLKDEIGLDQRTFQWSSARRRLYSFKSYIRQYKVVKCNDGENTSNETSQEQEESGRSTLKPFAKYEIVCELIIRHYQGNDETIHFSIWKRFSEFKRLHEILQSKFQWQLNSLDQGNGLRLPSDRVLQAVFLGSTSEKFLDSRLLELQEYWTTLCSSSTLFDFGDPKSHRYSKDISDFLDVEKYLHSPDIPDSVASTRRHDLDITRDNECNNAKLDTTMENKDEENENGSKQSNKEEVRMDISMLSEIQMSGSTELNLENDQGLGEIVFGNSPTPSRGLNTSRRTNGTRKKRKKKGTKAAYQRKLMDDF